MIVNFIVRHIPRKRFGQHFLQDSLILNQLIAELHLHKEDKVVEIGPGEGALTSYLLNYLSTLTAIEIDRDLLSALRQNYPSTLHLIEADALKVNYGQIGKNLRIVGNLPYNISTPLLFYLINYIDYIKDMHFMLQKEVVERLTSTVGVKEYGRLSVMIQYYCTVEYLFDVPNTAFFPPPKVDSAVIRLVPHVSSPYPLVSMDALKKTVSMAFAMRRKTLANNFKGVLSADALAGLGIEPTRRAETVSVQDYVKLTQYLANVQQ